VKRLSSGIIILFFMVPIAFASENDFIQNQTLICRDYISQSMKREFPVNGLSAAQLMYTACTKKEIAENLSEQENNHLKGLTTKLDDVKKELSQKELDNLKEKEKLVNDNWEWLKKSVKPKDLSRLTKQEIESLDPELRLIFKKMREALKDGDIEKALTFFHHLSKGKYRKMFSVLSPSALKEAASEDQELRFEGLWGDYKIKYEVIGNQKGEKWSFVLIFSQDQGEWKISEY
jgi:hypothetical protein